MVLTRQQWIYGAVGLVALVLAIWLLARAPSPNARERPGQPLTGAHDQKKESPPPAGSGPRNK